MFKKVYEEEYGVFGGAPFGALIGDYEFGSRTEDIELLEKVSQVAAAAHAPFLTAASPEMFNLESFTKLDAPRDLAKIFDTTEYAKWKSFRRRRTRATSAYAAAHADARCPTARTPCRSKHSTTRRASTAPTQQISVGKRRLALRRAAHQCLRPVQLVRLPSAASKAAGWWKVCRSTTSRPTTATWR